MRLFYMKISQSLAKMKENTMSNISLHAFDLVVVYLVLVNVLAGN